MQTTEQAVRHGLSEDEARDLTSRVLDLSEAESVRVSIDSGRRAFVRCADNRITTAGGSTDVTVTIASAFGKRLASSTTNRLDNRALTEAVRRSEALARLAPENPEYLGERGAQDYAGVRAYYPSTGEVTPESLAEAAAKAIAGAKKRDFVASGYIDVRAGSDTLANSSGLFAFHASTGVASTLTVRKRDGSSSGWAGDEAARWDNIETERIVEDAVRKCSEWQGKTALEPGRYDVVLEPTAAGMLMLRMTNAFDRRSADEGRSFFSNPGGGTRVGQSLFDSRVTITSDPAAEDAETAPFGEDGSPRTRTVWVEDGIVRNLATSRFWANETGVAELEEPGNLLMSGGSATLSEMVGTVERGVLLTRFWYIRGLNPRTLSYTGLTRDGTFLIEKGRVSRPVNNFRFNQSLVEMLNNVEMLGPPVRVAAGENSSVGTPIVVPAMKVRGFNLASVSDAI